MAGSEHELKKSRKLTEEMVTEVTFRNWKKIRRALRNIRSWSLMSVRCGCSLPVWRKRCNTVM